MNNKELDEYIEELEEYIDELQLDKISLQRTLDILYSFFEYEDLEEDFDEYLEYIDCSEL